MYIDPDKAHTNYELVSYKKSKRNTYCLSNTNEMHQVSII